MLSLPLFPVFFEHLIMLVAYVVPFLFPEESFRIWRVSTVVMNTSMVMIAAIIEADLGTAFISAPGHRAQIVFCHLIPLVS